MACSQRSFSYRLYAHINSRIPCMYIWRRTPHTTPEVLKDEDERERPAGAASIDGQSPAGIKWLARMPAAYRRVTREMKHPTTDGPHPSTTYSCAGSLFPETASSRHKSSVTATQNSALSIYLRHYEGTETATQYIHCRKKVVHQTLGHNFVNS